ncbi:hypothetical protein NP233_g9924 [Leucocoprinus birnbaumii]|uniref:DJ-1/PfpI domain-containing protein n=1 Tax=Leucocoprinus birnbaumii TaxID=56174 RepID=A0AAD5VJJ1_9AGAR|nr:hypothetical protein NP233_g9924 [Leucocoprinus birnbaumii]
MANTKTNPKALVLIADGTEEMEFTITYDTLVRADFDTTSAFVYATEQGAKASPATSITEATIMANSGARITIPNAPVATCSRGVKIMADTVFEYSRDSDSNEKFGPDKFDLLVLPGGLKGAETLANTNTGVPRLVREYLDKGKYVGTICAGSLAARSADLPRQPITSHPAVKSELEPAFDYSEESVVVSGKLVTTRGPGSTFAFILTLVELIQGEDKRLEISPPMMFPPKTPWNAPCQISAPVVLGDYRAWQGYPTLSLGNQYYVTGVNLVPVSPASVCNPTLQSCLAWIFLDNAFPSAASLFPTSRVIPMSSEVLNASGEDRSLLNAAEAEYTIGSNYLSTATGELSERDREQTEARLLQKLDRRMYYLVFTVILSRVIRYNVAAAQPLGFDKDLQLDTYLFSFVLSGFYVGYFTGAIFSCILLHQKISRPKAYLSYTLMAMGLVTFCTGLVTTYYQALLARFLQGFLEPLYFLCTMNYVSKWYKQNELVERVGHVVCGNFLGIGMSYLVATIWSVSKSGVLELPSWSWLFFVEGGVTAAAAIGAMLILPSLPDDRTISWLSSAEHVLARGRKSNDACDLPIDATLGLSLTLKDGKVWYLIAIRFLVTLCSSTALLYPPLTETMGYDTPVTLLLCVPPWLFAAALSLLQSRYSTEVQAHRGRIVLPYYVGALGFIIADATIHHAGFYPWLFLMAQTEIGNGIFYVWVTLVAGGPLAKQVMTLVFVTTIPHEYEDLADPGLRASGKHTLWRI